MRLSWGFDNLQMLLLNSCHTKARGLEFVVNWLEKELEEDKMYKCVKVWRELESIILEKIRPLWFYGE